MSPTAQISQETLINPSQATVISGVYLLQALSDNALTYLIHTGVIEISETIAR